MSSGCRFCFGKSLSFRLTLFYVVLFGAAYTILSIFIYVMASHALTSSIEADIMDDIEEMRSTLEHGGLEALKAYAEVEATEDGPDNLLIRIYDEKGNLIFSTDSKPWGLVPPPRLQDALGQKRSIDVIRLTGGETDTARSAVFRAQGYVIQQVVPVEWDVRLRRHLRKALIASAFVTILIALPCGWLFARRSMAQVKKIDQVARTIITGSDLTRRVPLRGARDELDELATTLNMMLGRIESYVRELSEMMDNTAHDFKTPLARIRSLAEEALMEEEMDDIQGNLVQIMEETDRFLSFINALLDISEARTGFIRLCKKSFSLKDLVHQSLQIFEGACRQKRLSLLVNVPEEDGLQIKGDRSRLFQALANILDNAVKFTPSHGSLRVSAFRGKDHITLAVEDSGQGIPEIERERIFERFYRGTPPGAEQGRGVGLSLAKAYVEAHGGFITVDPSSLGGSRFTIHLPMEP